MNKKFIWALVGAALELLGSAGALITLITGVIPDKKTEDSNNDEEKTNGSEH